VPRNTFAGRPRELLLEVPDAVPQAGRFLEFFLFDRFLKFQLKPGQLLQGKESADLHLDPTPLE
jgi:hypothetical protein